MACHRAAFTEEIAAWPTAQTWASEVFFPGGQWSIFAAGGQKDFFRGETLVNFILPTLKLREKHFYTKMLTVKYKISKSRGQVSPATLPTPMGAE